MNSILHVSGVYKITCKVNGKFYIGSSNNIHHRWIVHRCELNTHKHKNKHFQNAWNKYGKDSFQIEVLEIVEQDKLIEREQYYLDTMKPFGDVGYNLGLKANAGLFGRQLSDETKARMSASKKGIPMPEYQRIALSKILTGRKLSVAHVDKIRVALSKRIITEETRAKLSRSKAGRSLSQSTKDKLSKHYIVTTPDGIEYHVHGLKQFCEDHGLNYKCINGLAVRGTPSRKGWKCRKVS